MSQSTPRLFTTCHYCYQEHQFLPSYHEIHYWLLFHVISLEIHHFFVGIPRSWGSSWLSSCVSRCPRPMRQNEVRNQHGLMEEIRRSPVDMANIPLFTGFHNFHTCQVVQDFWTINSITDHHPTKKKLKNRTHFLAIHTNWKFRISHDVRVLTAEIIFIWGWWFFWSSVWEFLLGWCYRCGSTLDHQRKNEGLSLCPASVFCFFT